MKSILLIICLIFFSTLVFSDEKPKGVTAIATSHISANIVNPVGIGLDTITKKVYYLDNTYSFKSDTLKGKNRLFLLHFN